jgi:hypothetical protein
MARKKLTLAKVLKAAESGECVGFCLACGAEAEGVEPDARRYECECCGEPKVYGAEELVLMMA